MGTMLTWPLAMKCSHLVPALKEFYVLVKFKKLSSMAAFPNVIHGVQRIATTEFFKDSNAIFTNVFFKALVKGMPSRHSLRMYNRWVSPSIV